jgi:hypothetical protein
MMRIANRQFFKVRREVPAASCNVSRVRFGACTSVDLNCSNVTGGILFPESETTINTQVLVGRDAQQRMITQKPGKRELKTFYNEHT